MGAIDVWAQITTDRMARKPWMQTLLRWTGRAGEYVLPSVESIACDGRSKRRHRAAVGLVRA